MALIQDLRGREILDSRGNPTVEVMVTLDNGMRARASVPSGASTGTFEAHELRDNDPKRYLGKGVLTAVAHINTELRAILIGQDPRAQRSIDETMIALDGTATKARLGANAILGVSLAIARAAAHCERQELYVYLATLFSGAMPRTRFPIPMFNIINGGEHADSGLSVQEFKIVPSGISGYPEQLRAGSEIFHVLQQLLRDGGHTTDVGDEGGFAPKLASHDAAFAIIVRAIEAAGYMPGSQIRLDIDAAANSFYDGAIDRYQLRPEKRILDRSALTAVYQDWVKRYPLRSIEDPLHESDWEGWANFRSEVGASVMLIGDDLLVTNVKRVQTAIEKRACHAVLIKPNQVGTLTETIDCIELAQRHGLRTVISHRSGETCDDFIADLAVAGGAEYIKTGSLARGERLAKYNRLAQIYHDLHVAK